MLVMRLKKPVSVTHEALVKPFHLLYLIDLHLLKKWNEGEVNLISKIAFSCQFLISDIGFMVDRTLDKYKKRG